jgi:TRAP-type mannitol/chloroaromatic compound transport system substrate-binding protein
VAFRAGVSNGWRERGRSGQVVWRMAAYRGSPIYRQLLVGQVPDRLRQRLHTLTDGRFTLELVDHSPLSSSEILWQVNQGQLQCGYVDVYYDRLLQPLIFAKAVPFGLDPREQTAWLGYKRPGDAIPFHQTVYPRLKLKGTPLDQLRSFPITLTGGQMGGWFKREVDSLADLKGLKMRIPGLGADVLRAFGARTDIDLVDTGFIPADQILPMVRDNKLDAAEWIGPYDDRLLGLYTAARFYYSPGWWEPSTTNELMVNQQALAELSPAHREALKTACAEIYLWSRREYDLRNIEALRQLRQSGVQLRRFSPEMMRAFRQESQRLLQEKARQDSNGFGYVYPEWLRFRDRIRDTIGITQYRPEDPSA